MHDHRGLGVFATPSGHPVGHQRALASTGLPGDEHWSERFRLHGLVQGLEVGFAAQIQPAARGPVGFMGHSLPRQRIGHLAFRISLVDQLP